MPLSRTLVHTCRGKPHKVALNVLMSWCRFMWIVGVYTVEYEYSQKKEGEIRLDCQCWWNKADATWYFSPFFPRLVFVFFSVAGICNCLCTQTTDTALTGGTGGREFEHDLGDKYVIIADSSTTTPLILIAYPVNNQYFLLNQNKTKWEQ